MTDEQLIQWLCELVESALTDPDFFSPSKEDIQRLKQELDERYIPNILEKWT